MTHEYVLLIALALIGVCALICAFENIRIHNRLLRVERELFPLHKRKQN